MSDFGNNKSWSDNSVTKAITALTGTANNRDFCHRVGDTVYDDGPIRLPTDLYEATWNTFQKDLELVTADNI